MSIGDPMPGLGGMYPPPPSGVPLVTRRVELPDGRQYISGGFPSNRYVVVVSPEASEVLEFGNIDELVAYLRQRRQDEDRMPTNTRFTIVEGPRVHISKGAFKYLMLPNGMRVPLFTEPDSLEADPTGALVDPFEVESKTGEVLEDDLPLDGPESEIDD